MKSKLTKAFEYQPQLEIKDGVYVSGQRRVSNFTLVAHNMKFNEHRVAERFVRFKQGRKTSVVFKMTSDDMVTPDRFRNFCFRCGNYIWGGGMAELFALHTDLARAFNKVKS